MAVTPPSAFTVDASVGMSFSAASARAALPGSDLAGDSVVRICNLGPCPLAFALGSATVATTASTGTVVMPGRTEFFALGSATYIAGVSTSGANTNTVVNVSTGN
jgi:hypothetical protein